MGIEEAVLIDRGLRFRGISSSDSNQGHQSQNKKPRSQQIYGGYSDFDVVNNPTMNHMVEEAIDLNPTEIFNLQTAMELMSFPTKNSMRSSSDSFKGFLAVNQQSKPDEGSSSRTPSSISYQKGFGQEEPSIEFTKHGLILNAQPAADYQQRLQSRRGLSLSLSPHNPSELMVQSFESSAADELRYGQAYRSQQTRSSCLGQYRAYELRSSKYLPAAQELLYEFCNLGTKHQNSRGKKSKQPSIDETTLINPSLYVIDFLELQKRKCRLVSMLKEVDRRYRQYCEQMRGVVASFEAVVGEGSAELYSSLASIAMSKHFRCLRDGIVAQIKAIKKVLGEKDSISPGTTKGETPRLRILYQKLKQQKAYENMGMMENQPWRPQRGLPERSVSTLRAWLFEHFLHPYPSDVDKHILARQTGLSRSQVSNWFINARVRLWKPMVEEMYLEEEKGQEEGSMSQDKERNSSLQPQPATDEQPELPHDEDSLSSIINGDLDAKRKTVTSATTNGCDRGMKNQQQQAAYGPVDYDFASPYHNDGSSSSQRQYANNGGASLTLGLHHHNSDDQNVYHQSLFFSRDSCSHVDECSPLHFSVMQDGQGVHGSSIFEPQSYRNGHLVGTQLLHDFVG